MTSDGSGEFNRPSPAAAVIRRQSIELQLFESLVHHLIEKGVLTRNDALSIVQTVAEIERGATEEDGPAGEGNGRLAMLERVYASYELLPEALPKSVSDDDDKILQLRPPLHGDRPRFPRDD